MSATEVARLPVITQPQWGAIPLGAWVQVTGKLEQATPLGAIHEGGFEWFVRPLGKDPIAVYVLRDPGRTVGSQVSVLARDVGSIRLQDRQGTMREYPAVIGVAIDKSSVLLGQVGSFGSTREAPSAWIAAGAVVVIVAAWIGVRVLSKRSAARAVNRIHAVADRARAHRSGACSAEVRP